MASIFMLGYMLTIVWKQSKYYIYRRMERPSDIRILRISPGLFSDPLRGSLETTTVQHSEPYHVILYSKNTAPRNKLISIDGAVLRITEGSDRILRDFRKTDRSIVLWDETICNDESDARETSVNRFLNRKLFASAKETSIWLEPSNDDIEMGLLMLKYFSKGGRETQDESHLWMNFSPNFVRSGLSSVFNHLLSRSKQVAQAIASTPILTLRSGNICVSWSNDLNHVLMFSRAIKFAVVHPRWRELGLHSIDMDPMVRLLQLQIDSGPHWELCSKSQRSIDRLLDLMYDLRNNDATDPRDKVYSILGLVDLGSPKPITPDYTQSLTTLYDRLESLIFFQDRQCAYEGCTNI